MRGPQQVSRFVGRVATRFVPNVVLCVERFQLRSARENDQGRSAQGRLPFESHDGIAKRRKRALSDAPLLVLTLVLTGVSG
jgi:hypothetical protein